MANNNNTHQEESNSEKWLIDSGASVHITNNDEKMSKVEPAFETIIVGNGMEVKAKKKGTVTIKTEQGTLLQMSNVLYVPNFEKNLLSVAKLTSNGATVSADSEKMTLTKGELTITTKKETGNNGMYYITGERIETQESGLVALNKQPRSVDINVAHKLLGHAGGASIIKLAKTISWTLTGTLTKCEACALARARAKNVPKTPSASYRSCHSPLHRSKWPIQELPRRKQVLGDHCRRL